MLGSGEVVYARVVARAVYLNRYICNLWSFEKSFVYPSPKTQQIEMMLYCLALSKSASDAVNKSVAIKSDLSLALVPLSRWRTRSGSHFTTLTGIFGIMRFVIIL